MIERMIALSMHDPNPTDDPIVNELQLLDQLLVGVLRISQWQRVHRLPEEVLVCSLLRAHNSNNKTDGDTRATTRREERARLAKHLLVARAHNTGLDVNLVPIAVNVADTLLNALEEEGSM